MSTFRTFFRKTHLYRCSGIVCGGDGYNVEEGCLAGCNADKGQTVDQSGCEFYCGD
jgi:hypothetical protein